MEKLSKAPPMLTKEKVELERKSVIELKDLLEKQEKLLQNKNLMKSLPDHGQKIKLFIEKIRKVLELRDSVDDASDRLNRIQLGGQPSEERINYANNYEFVIKENSDVKMKMHPQRFKPNRLIKDKKDNSSKAESSDVKKSDPSTVESMSTDVTLSLSTNEDSQPHSTMETNQGNETQRRLKYKYDASLEETFPYDKKHANGTQLISIQEGMNLLKHHHVTLQEAEMKRAELMLAANISTKLSTDIGSWRGDKFNRYRDGPGTSHEENDDDDNDRDNEYADMKNSDDDADYDGVD